MERLLCTALQGGWWAVITFWWYWPIAIAIVAPIYEHDNLVHTWTPPIIKLLFGGILGLLTNPFIALFTIGAESHVRRFYPHDSLWNEDMSASTSAYQEGTAMSQDLEVITVTTDTNPKNA